MENKGTKELKKVKKEEPTLKLTDLPWLVMEMILLLLDYRSLNRLAGVSRLCRIAATQSELWKHYVIEVKSQQELTHGGKLESMLKMERFNKIKKIKFNHYRIRIPEASVQCMLDHQNLCILDLYSTILHDISPSLLSTLLTRMEVVNLNLAEITPSQLQQLFTAIKEGSSLKTLNLCNVNLSSVEPSLLTRAKTVCNISS